MDIEELRARAMASMPPKPRNKFKECCQASPDEFPTGRVPSADKLFDTNVMQLAAVATTSFPAFSGSHKETDVIVSNLQAPYSHARSPAVEEKDDNLVIRFSDGDSDSDAEEPNWKKDQGLGIAASRGITTCTAPYQSNSSSSQIAMVPQQALRMRNQMATMQKPLAAIRTTTPNTIHVLNMSSRVSGRGLPRQSSRSQKPNVGQKISLTQKRVANPCASGTKSSGSDLENLRQQIATKENELKLQRNIRSGKGQEKISLPSRELYASAILISTSPNTSGKLPANASLSKLVGSACDEKNSKDKLQVPKVPVQASSYVCLKAVNSNGLEQQGLTLNTNIEHGCAKSRASNEDAMEELHLAGSKRPLVEDELLGQKFSTSAVSFSGKHAAAALMVPDSVQKHSSEINEGISAAVLTPFACSKRKNPEDYTHTNSYQSVNREGSKKCRFDGSTTDAKKDLISSQRQSSGQDTSLEQQEHCLVEGFENKAEAEALQVTSKMGFEENQRGDSNKINEATQCQHYVQNINSTVLQTLDNCKINTQEVADKTECYPFSQEAGFGNKIDSNHLFPAKAVCQSKMVSETSGDVPTEGPGGVQKIASEIVDTSRAFVGWQDGRGPLHKARLTGIQNYFLEHGNMSMQMLMEEEELADKELEEAQEHRSRCEIEERLAWRAYRKAQEAVQAANKRCAYLHQKRELLSAQVQAVGMRDYSLKESPGKAQQSGEGHLSHSFQEHNDLAILAFGNPLLQHHQEAFKQMGNKLDEHGLGVDCAIMSSLPPYISDDPYSSKQNFQSAQQNSNNRFLISDSVPGSLEELYTADKTAIQDKILDSESPREDVGQDQDNVSCASELLHAGSAMLHIRRMQRKLKGELAVSQEMALEITEAMNQAHIPQTSHTHDSSLQHASRSEISFHRELFNLSGNTKSGAPSNRGLRRENILFDGKKGTLGGGKEDHELISAFYFPTENLSDETKRTSLTCGVASANFSLANNYVSNLNLEGAKTMAGNGDNSQLQHGEQWQASSIIPQKIANIWYPCSNEETPSVRRDLPSGCTDEVHDGLKEQHFLSTSNEDAENLVMDEMRGSVSKQNRTISTLLNKNSNWKQVSAHQFSGCKSPINSLAKFSFTEGSKEPLCSDSVSLTNKCKEDRTTTSNAETSTESLHGQNYDHEEYTIQCPEGKTESFVCERFQELPAVVMKKTNARHLKSLIDQGMQENSAGTCHSDNSFASNMEHEKISGKGLDTIVPNVKYTRDSFEEVNEEKSHSGSVDEGGIEEKENIAAWKNSIEGHIKSNNLSTHLRFEEWEQSDLAVATDLAGKFVASEAGCMESGDHTLGFLQACILRRDSDADTLQDGCTSKKIEGVNRDFTEEANGQQTKRSFDMLSSKLRVVFNHAKIIFSNRDGTLANVSAEKMQHVSQVYPQYVSKFLRYGSPLDIFKSYRMYSNLSGVNNVSVDLNTWSHAIDPFWPLCKFEHRGKCNNEDCIWQHAKDYTLTPFQVLERLNKYGNADVSCSVVDHEEVKCSANHESLISFVAKAKEAIARASKIHCAMTMDQSEVSQGLSCESIFSNRLKVPVYRIGSHLIKADNCIAGSLLAWSSRQFWKFGFCQYFSVPFAVQRVLPSDVPCLRSSAVREWMHGNNNKLPTCLYASSAIGRQNDVKKHLFGGLGDVECWLELAIDSMNFDSNIEKSDGRKKALCVLSRAVEINPDSVLLWMVYLHIFYWKEKVIGKDDMFHHAVQYNKGSYELWLLFINSRLQLDHRLEAYMLAITALCQNSKECADEKHNISISSYILDLALQMLNFLCMSDYKHRALSWIDELLYGSTKGSHKRQLDYINVSTLLACLTKHDACVLWVCFIYLMVYGRLPKSVVGRLEFKQELPFDVDWCSCELTEVSRAHVLKLMHTAVSSLSSCLDADILESCPNDKDFRLPMHALAVNHIKCVAAIEGLPSAHTLSCQYRKLHPTCTELVIVSSSIEEQCGDDNAGFAVFEEALFNWPEGKPGIQRMWNQFVGYALESKGIDFAKDLMNQWPYYMQQHKGQDGIASLRHAIGKQRFEKSMYNRKQADDSFASTLGTKAHYYNASGDTDMTHGPQEAMFGLLNRAMHKLFNDDLSEAQAASDTALKAALDDEDVKHCIRENAALTFFGFLDGSDLRKNGFDTRLLGLLDKCFVESRLFPSSKPLSRAFAESIKKPKIRVFIDNLLGPIPMDSSRLNSILEICYGPSLLPKEFDTLKDLVDFVEGLLELAPSNVELTLSVCRLIGQKYDSHRVSSIAAIHWASSLLMNSLFQSFPVAPENTWLEVGNCISNLGLDIILEEFYQQAASVHPFSVALWRSLLSFQHNTENCARLAEAAKQRGLSID